MPRNAPIAIASDPGVADGLLFWSAAQHDMAHSLIFALITPTICALPATEATFAAL